MKNLKKVLALVLAFACAFTMFASAAFTDQADISQTEAVDMLTALGVIEGFPDGSFAPDATITRAQAAKMIYTIWNGGNADASAFEGKSVFTDVYSGHWAEGYINFCYINGIINGLSATKFGPDDSVTGTQLAKMLLICMGYQADKSGLEGTGYSQRTNALATQNGLYVDVATSVSQAMPRQFAAQLMYNALKADTVEWSTDSNAYSKVTTTSMVGKQDPVTGDITFTNVTVNETMGKKCMDLVIDEKILLTQVDKEDGRETYSLNSGAYTRVAKDYSDLIGQRVNIMYKEGERDKVYGVYAHEDSKVVASGFVGQLETVSGGEKVKMNGTEYKVEDIDGSLDNTAGIVYELNKDTVASTDLATLASGVSNTNRTRNNAAAELKLIDNDGDGKVDTAMQTPVKVGQVSAVTKTSITVNGVGTFKFADDTIYEDVAKNDYVRVIADDFVSEGGNHVEKLDVVNAKVEGTRTGEAKVDGTWYKLAHESNWVAVTTGTTYDLVIVGNTILYADETDGTVANVAFISAKGSFEAILGESEGTVKVRMFFNDGTNSEVKVSKVAGNKITSDTVPGVGSLVTYTKLSDGTYDVKAVSDSNKAGTDDFVPNGEKSAVSSSVNGAYYDSKIYGVSVADDAVVYVKTGSETKVLTGAQVKAWDKTLTTTDGSGNKLMFTSDLLVKESNGIDYVQVATLVAPQAIDVPGAKDVSYAYAVTDEYDTTLDGENKAAVDVWNGTETVTLYADAADVMAGGVKAGDLVSYKVNGKFIESVSTTSTVAAVLGFDGKAEGELKVKNSQGTFTYTLSDDVVVLTVDDAAGKGVAGAGIDAIVEAGSDDNNTSKRVPNIMYVLNSDNKVVAIVIDSENNKLDGEASL